MTNSTWKEEGTKARKEGKLATDCPYERGTFGYSQWMKGFESVVNTGFDEWTRTSDTSHIHQSN